jgi:hypothetical protein
MDFVMRRLQSVRETFTVRRDQLRLGERCPHIEQAVKTSVGNGSQCTARLQGEVSGSPFARKVRGPCSLWQRLGDAASRTRNGINAFARFVRRCSFYCTFDVLL